MAAPQPKSGHLYSEAFLAFVRRKPCAFCEDLYAPSSPHHYPPKGRGVIRDDMTIPVCVIDHKRCHGETVEGRGPIPEEWQEQAMQATRSAFLEEATDDEMRHYRADLAEHKRGRIWIDF